ncbi:MAG: LCP family protein [Chroococcidiopsidaceae cyanobacterium CP_BM_ER_R8_30]|nr:LCP family protein [Chroococcidiopsidaceae cyanobacterium CP_BM_ER_R8_30]
MVKQANRLEKRLEPQPVMAEEKRQLRAKKRNLFRLRNLSIIFPQNRWLFRGFGITLFVMLGASVALLTPIWSSRNRLNQTQQFLWEGTKSQNNFWSNSFQYELSRPINILVLGFGSVSGATDFNQPSNTVLLLRLDPTDNSIKALFIPQDSQVVIPGVGLAKVSLANARGGSALAARIVSRMLNNVPINGYVRITADGLRELVDLLGGVEVFVPQQIASDTVQHPDIEPGWQTLNGEEAEQFARFSDSRIGDIARIQRQQALLQALCDRLSSPTVLPHLPELSQVMLKYIDTNLNREEIATLVNFGVGVDPQNLQMLLLPGSTSRFSRDPSSYWLDAGAINQMMADYFAVKAIGVTNKPSPTMLKGSPEEAPATQERKLKIAIQNASAKSNSSQSLSKYLRAQGFTNVYMGADWPDNRQRQTEIIVQKGNLSGAVAVQKVLGLGNIKVAATGDLKSDLTIRVGKDWLELHGKSVEKS